MKKFLIILPILFIFFYGNAVGEYMTGVYNFSQTNFKIPNSQIIIDPNVSGSVYLNSIASTAAETSEERVPHTNLKHIVINCDPGSQYDIDTQIFILTIGDDFPYGMIIDEWKASCNCNPDVEMNMNLKYADSFITLANDAVIDALDTTDGNSSEDTDANINSGNAIANGKVIYLEWDADPEGTCVQLVIDIWCHAAPQT